MVDTDPLELPKSPGSAGCRVTIIPALLAAIPQLRGTATVSHNKFSASQGTGSWPHSKLLSLD